MYGEVGAGMALTCCAVSTSQMIVLSRLGLCALLAASSSPASYSLSACRCSRSTSLSSASPMKARAWLGLGLG